MASTMDKLVAFRKELDNLVASGKTVRRAVAAPFAEASAPFAEASAPCRGGRVAARRAMERSVRLSVATTAAAAR